jgi:Salmonella virulence plasmid 65kDa B protein
VTPTSTGRTAGQFSVTPTGAASYNIPLWTPPGARGIEPHLALHYTSGGPDGPMGPGWALTGLSAIMRCDKTWASTNGAPAGVTLATTDDFCLDGNRLRLTSGTPGISPTQMYHAIHLANGQPW